MKKQFNMRRSAHALKSCSAKSTTFALKDKKKFTYKIKKICFSTFRPKTDTNGAVTSFIIIIIIIIIIFNTFSLSKFDKNMIALRFKDLQIVP